MSTTYHATVLSADRFGEWTSLVEASPLGSVYSTPAYLEALTTATSGRYRILAVERGHEIVAGIALYEEDTSGGSIVSPRLLLYYNGVVLRPLDSRYPLKGTSEWLHAADTLMDALGQARYGRVTLKSLPGLFDTRPFQARGWDVTPTYSYVVPIGNLEATWSRIDQNLRRLVRRSENAGITVSEDDDVDSLLRLHADTMARKDQAIYLAPDRFRTFVSTLRRSGLAALYHARMPDGRSVATALVLLGRHPVAHTVTAAADPEHQADGTNALLRWHSFQDLHRRGFQGVNLTDASLNAVTRFKSQLGGDLSLSLEVDAPRTLRYRSWLARRVTRQRLRSWESRQARRLLHLDRH